MEAKDLRIGDWVYNTMDGNETPCKVSLEDFKEEAEGAHPFSVFEPIPLTEDILNKNGFDKTLYTDANAIYQLQHKIEGMYSIKDQCFEIQIFCNPTKLHYVHELQHALRLCGLKDLSEEFKIN